MQQQEYDIEVLVKLLSQQLQEVKNNGLIDEIYGTKEEFNRIYNTFLDEEQGNKVIDDIGLMNSMATYTETSKAYKGKERNALNTTINISREVRAGEEAEEEPETNESGGGFNKFFRGKKKNGN